MWPDVRIKHCPDLPKSGPKSSHISFYLKMMFSSYLKKSQDIWATFLKKICIQCLSKITQSGHTKLPTQTMGEPPAACSIKLIPSYFTAISP